jgi:hypothetical protein
MARVGMGRGCLGPLNVAGAVAKRYDIKLDIFKATEYVDRRLFVRTSILSRWHEVGRSVGRSTLSGPFVFVIQCYDQKKNNHTFVTAFMKQSNDAVRQ